MLALCAINALRITSSARVLARSAVITALRTDNVIGRPMRALLALGGAIYISVETRLASHAALTVCCGSLACFTKLAIGVSTGGGIEFTSGTGDATILGLMVLIGPCGAV